MYTQIDAFPSSPETTKQFTDFVEYQAKEGVNAEVAMGAQAIYMSNGWGQLHTPAVFYPLTKKQKMIVDYRFNHADGSAQLRLRHFSKYTPLFNQDGTVINENSLCQDNIVYENNPKDPLAEWFRLNKQTAIYEAGPATNGLVLVKESRTTNGLLVPGEAPAVLANTLHGSPFTRGKLGYSDAVSVSRPQQEVVGRYEINALGDFLVGHSINASVDPYPRSAA